MRIGEENGQKVLVIANYGKDAAELMLPGEVKEILLSNTGRKALPGEKIMLESLETAVLFL